MEPILAHILEAIRRAPSAHNTQPWWLQRRGDSLEIGLRPERMLPIGDARGLDALHAVGAALENALLALAHLGQSGSYEIAGLAAAGAPVVRLRWEPDSSVRSDESLYRMIPIRRTSRLPYEDKPISADAREAIAAAGAPCRLLWMEKKSEIDEVLGFVARATADQLRDDALAKELFAWLRFHRGDPRWYRDGLSAECMSWSRWEAFLSSVLLAPRTLRLLARFGLLGALCSDVERVAPRAPLLCLLTVEGDGAMVRIEAGRRLQRVWLAAAAQGLVTHPLSAAVDVAWSRARVYERFRVQPGMSHVNLFRVGRSRVTPRSARLPADELLISG